MKKILLLAGFTTFSFSVFAQDLMSKKGTPILPEAKDWSISFDAVPFLDYAFDKSRIMSPTAASSAAGSMSFQTPFTIVGKCMKDANTAYRLKLRIGMNSSTQNTYVLKDGTTTNEMVKDSKVTTGHNITLGAGMQHYRGKGRLRGFYGAEGMIMLNKAASDKFTYGNAVTSTFLGTRTTEDKKGSSFGLGVRGFVGAEYFFAPKMSMGVELGWGPSLYSTGDGTKTEEMWDSSSSTVKSVSTKTGGNSGFNLDVDNASGAIMFAIYF
jgi:hypothetical protein